MHALSHTRSATTVVRIALIATIALVATEFIAGAFSGSLSLVSDGWHNLTDVPTLVLSWIALYLERRPPDPKKTFGYQRAGVLSAFVNGLLLVVVALYICYEGYERIIVPRPVGTRAMIVVGLIALVVNGGISFGLMPGRNDLNLRAVFLHNLGDALSNLGIIAGGWLIEKTGHTFIDPLIAFLIAGMILWSAIGVITESANILLESTPKGIHVDRVAGAMLSVPGVREVHDVHIWSLGSRSHALACHIQILDMTTSESERIAHRVREVLATEFGIHHTTIQFEHTHEPGDFHRYMPEPVPMTKDSGT
ncbi:MAG: cation transporter [Acidobacteria bacterium]|nr:cation transporter [Acidobacteriota bacterium]